jgi:polyisoprenyl-teichoic acid--peptidoglycan teichoic acid transferase
MQKNNKRLRKQLILIGFLIIILIITMIVIYLGGTLFRSQLPIFQLMDGNSTGAILIGPKPPANPGVVDLGEGPNVTLYMIMGSDYRPGSGFRTDIIMLVAVDRISGRASLISFPRDLWVSIPGVGEQRINTAMQTGGFQLLADTLQTNFGVYPTKYAMIDMEGFLNVIDFLGGIEFETEHYTGDACDSSLNPSGWCEVGPGQVSFDSEWALWYVRARYASSDFDRMRRSQEVLKAVMDKAMSPAVIRVLPELISIYENEIDSNISPDQLLPIVRLALNLDSSQDIRRYNIGLNEVTPWTTPGGGSVLIPNTPAIQAILQEALIFE